jgi:hypothetical protein
MTSGTIKRLPIAAEVIVFMRGLCSSMIIQRVPGQVDRRIFVGLGQQAVLLRDMMLVGP